MGRQWYGMKGLRTVDHRLLTVALVGGVTSTFRVSEPSSIGGCWLASEALACSRTKAPSPVDQGCFSRMVWGEGLLLGTCFRSSNRGTGGTGWGVGRARRAEHRPVERRVVKSWNQDRDRDRDWGRFPLFERKSRAIPNVNDAPQRWKVLP